MFDSRRYLRVLLDLEVPVWPLAVLACGLAVLLTARTSEESTNENTPSTSSIAKDDDNIARQALNEGTKLVLVVRNDLALPKGTVAQLCAQVTLECYKQASQFAPRVLGEWEHEGQAKVTLKCMDLEELSRLLEQAHASNLVACSSDSNGEPAVLGIGPGPIGLINTVSGSLKLY